MNVENEVINIDPDENELRIQALKAFNQKYLENGDIICISSDESIESMTLETPEVKQTNGFALADLKHESNEEVLRKTALDSIKSGQKRRFIISLDSSDSEDDSFEPKKVVNQSKKMPVISQIRRGELTKLLTQKETLANNIRVRKESITKKEAKLHQCNNDVISQSKIIAQLKKELAISEIKLKSLISSRKSQKITLNLDRNRLRLAEKQHRNLARSCDRSKELYMQSLKEESITMRSFDFAKLQGHMLCSVIEYLRGITIRNLLVSILCRKKTQIESLSKSNRLPTDVTAKSTSSVAVTCPILCPYEMDGKCLDSNCLYDHKTKKTIHKLPSLCFSITTCQVCRKSLNHLQNSTTQEPSLKSWHTLYYKFLKASDSNILQKLQTCLAEQVDSCPRESDLLAHYILAQVLDIPSELKVSQLYSFLLTKNIPCNLSVFAVSSVLLEQSTRDALFSKLKAELLRKVLQPDASLAESHRHCRTLVRIVACNTSIDQHSIRNWIASCLHLQRVQTQPGHIIRLFLMYLLSLSKLDLLHICNSHEDLPQLTRSQLASIQEIFLDQWNMADLETALFLLQNEPHCSATPFAVTHLYCQHLVASNQVPMAVDILSRVSNLGNFGQLALFYLQERHSLQPTGLDFSLRESSIRALLAWSGDNTARCVTLVGAVCTRLLPEFRGDGTRAIRHLLGLSLLPLHGLEGLAELDEDSRMHLWILYFLLARIKLADGELVDVDQVVKEFLEHGLTALKTAEPLSARLFGLLTLKLLDFGISDAVYFDLIYNFLVEEAPLSLALAEQSSWLVEFVQNIRLQRIMYRGEFVQFLFSLVEMYGFAVLPSICRNLIIVKETSLALKLCDVLRSDQMSEPRYWELYLCMWIQCQGTEKRENKEMGVLLQKTVQLLYEALNCVPSSEILWFYMAQLTNYSVVRGWKPQILELAKRCAKTAYVNEAWSKAKNFFTKNS